MEIDSLHYNLNTINGFQIPFMFIISEREAGKSTAVIMQSFKAFKKDKTPTILVRRHVADITDIYIDDLFKLINKFSDTPVEYHFKSGSIKQGIVDVYIEDDVFMRIIGLSIPLIRLKSLMLPKTKYIVFDEFICNLRGGEKYLKDESFKFFEMANTFIRESENLKFYFMGNPYSLFNPYFAKLGVDTSKIKRGNIYKGNGFLIECYEIKQELKEMILAKNPLYQFDNSYKKYAFDGINIDDQNIRILKTHPNNYYLKFIFRINGKFLHVYKNPNYSDSMFWIEQCDTISSSKIAFTFDFNEMINGTMLLTHSDMTTFKYFKQCFRNRMIEYSSIECYYYIEEIYSRL